MMAIKWIQFPALMGILLLTNRLLLFAKASAPPHQAANLGWQSALSRYAFFRPGNGHQRRVATHANLLQCDKQSCSSLDAHESPPSSRIVHVSRPSLLSRIRIFDPFQREEQKLQRQQYLALAAPPVKDPSTVHPRLDPNPSSSLTTQPRKSKTTTKKTPVATRPLEFWETMICGAISRSVAQTIMHPANTMKTMLQNSKGPMIPTILELMRPSSFHRLTYGAGTNFLLSVPQGALNFSVLEYVRKHLGVFVSNHPYLAERADTLSAGLDFVSSSISTVVVSIVATPQMMITDNIMAGNYPNLPQAVQGLFQSGGVKAFYRGWSAGMFGKIPSYALTWTLFQQCKHLRDRITHHRPATNIENSAMGCLASTTTVCIMIPLDTIKTRLVTQGGKASLSNVPYKGIVDCAVRVFREEGIGAFYRGLPPRLVSVVPMIGIQFAVYEAMKRTMLKRPLPQKAYQEEQKMMKKKSRKDQQSEPSPPTDTVTILEDVEEVSLTKPGNLGDEDETLVVQQPDPKSEQYRNGALGKKPLFPAHRQKSLK